MLYELIVGEFGIAPSEYWQMSPSEAHLIIDAKRPKTIGGIQEDDLDNMMLRRQQLLDDGVKLL